jgi:hypothetical protein
MNHCYTGAFLEMISFCDCFVDYEGTYKDRVEKAGEIILNIAVVFALLSVAQASYVISQSQTKDTMLNAILSTVLSGVFCGFLSCWFTFHYKRIGEIGWHRTNGNCLKQLDKDGDGETPFLHAASRTFPHVPAALSVFVQTQCACAAQRVCSSSML